MITLYTWDTPNGRKVPILLEELGLAWQLNLVDIGHDEQFAPEFLAVSPNNKIPAIVDEDTGGAPQAVFESGAILSYLAEKTGRFLASSGPARWQALEWLHWQVGGLAPIVGQLGWFVRAQEKSELAIRRYTDEVDRLLGVLERRVAEVPWLAGDAYGIADIAAYPWTEAALTHLGRQLGDRLDSKPALHAWLERVGARPAVQRAMGLKLSK